MGLTPIPIACQTYQSPSQTIDGQRLINCYTVPTSTNAVVTFVLRARNGQSVFGTIPGNLSIRGIHLFNGYLYCIAGNCIYKFDTSGNYYFISFIEDDGQYVYMENSQTELAILLANGDYYVLEYNDIISLFPNGTYGYKLSTLTYADQNMIASISPTAMQAPSFLVGSVEDATTFPAQYVTSASQYSDNIIRIFAFNSEIWVMKERSIEYFYNTGDNVQPYAQISGSTRRDYGIIGAFAICQRSEYGYFVGSDKCIYQSQGSSSSPAKISNWGISSAIENMTNPSDCRAFYFNELGKSFIAFNFMTDKRTFIWNISDSVWSEYQTYGASGWNISDSIRFNGLNILVASDSGTLYFSDHKNFTDNGTPIQMSAYMPTINSLNVDDKASGKEWVSHFEIQILLETGTAQTSTEANISLDYSDNGGLTFRGQRILSVGSAGDSAKRVVARILGASRERIYRVQWSDPVQKIIYGMLGRFRRYGS